MLIYCYHTPLLISSPPPAYLEYIDPDPGAQTGGGGGGCVAVLLTWSVFVLTCKCLLWSLSQLACSWHVLWMNESRWYYRRVLYMCRAFQQPHTQVCLLICRRALFCEWKSALLTCVNFFSPLSQRCVVYL